MFGMAENIEDVVLHEATEKRYLNYAMSVITSRALPDVRDGLKPVQRRILYAMYENLNLVPESKHRKSAAVVGEVMAKYHPHGDSSIYDAMVRMAQGFALRYPLVDGQGNFGSVDGDSAAAMRYTEAKLRHLAVELLTELKKETVDERPNYDGTYMEPVVLPAQFPNLLVNGASGIAVGMATNIPPHNLKEVVGALIALIDEPSLPLEKLVPKYVKGPDFPTGGEILNSEEELLQIYRTGHGSVEMRGTWVMEEENKRRSVIITSIPYTLVKADLITEIADHIRQGKVPQLVDIRDESTDEVRVVLELAKDASADAAMAYLCKKTGLQSRFSVNMTALCPVDTAETKKPTRVSTKGAQLPAFDMGSAEPTRPARLGLREVLDYFLEFRYDTTRRRLEYDLRQLERRIHLLRGFELIFNALDEAIAIIRASDGKADAAKRLMARFGLDAEQTEAILETRLYRLAKLEIDAIRKELAEKEAAAAELRSLLASEDHMWTLIRTELVNLRDAYGDKRRTRIVGPQAEVNFTEEQYIVAEDAMVMVTRDGWFKRQKSYNDLSSIRVREGDSLGWVMPASTRDTLVLFTDRGKAYSMRVDAVPLTTGYGEPINAKFGFTDGEQIVGAVATDVRILPPVPDWISSTLQPDEPRPPYVVAMSRGGKVLRMSLSAFAEPSTVSGRTYMRLDGDVENDAITSVQLSDGTETVSLATRMGRCINFPVVEVNVLSGPGKGVTAIRMTSPDDRVIGFALGRARDEGLRVETNRGREEVVRTSKYSVVSRGGRGHEIIRSGYLSRVVGEPVVYPLAWREPARPVAPKVPKGPEDLGQGSLI